MTKEEIQKAADMNKFVIFCGIKLHEDTDGILTTKAQIIKKGRKVIVIRVSVTSDKGILLAEGDFTYFNAVD